MPHYDYNTELHPWKDREHPKDQNDTSAFLFTFFATIPELGAPRTANKDGVGVGMSQTTHEYRMGWKLADFGVLDKARTVQH